MNPLASVTTGCCEPIAERRVQMGMPLDLLWLTVPAYVVLQIVALMRSSGGSRVVAVLPLFVMVPVFALTAIAFSQESNLWPIWILIACPIATMYVAVIAFLPRPSGRGKSCEF